jgi:hypothetical protein
MTPYGSNRNGMTLCGAREKLARIFPLFFITSQMEDSFLPYNLAISE